MVAAAGQATVLGVGVGLVTRSAIANAAGTSTCEAFFTFHGTSYTHFIDFEDRTALVNAEVREYTIGNENRVHQLHGEVRVVFASEDEEE